MLQHKCDVAGVLFDEVDKNTRPESSTVAKDALARRLFTVLE